MVHSTVRASDNLEHHRRTVSTGPARVLIVSDDSLSRHFLALMVEHPQVVTVVVGHDDRAVAVARHVQPHLILFDTRWCLEYGPELCRQIKAAGVQGHHHVVAFVDDPELEVDLADAGADVVVLKPFSVKAVLGQIDRILRGIDGELLGPHTWGCCASESHATA